MVKVVGIGDNVVDKYVHIETMYSGGNTVNFSMFVKMLATRGSQGAIAYDGAHYFHHSPEYVEAVDTMGAGDSFITAFLLFYLKYNDIAQRQ